MWHTIIFYYILSADWKLLWSTLLFIMRISVGSRELMWPTGLFIVVLEELVEFDK